MEGSAVGLETIWDLVDRCVEHRPDGSQLETRSTNVQFIVLYRKDGVSLKDQHGS